MLNLKQIRYFCGEDSIHLKGLGLNPTAIYLNRKKIVEKFKQFKVSKNLYVINENLIELAPEEKMGYFPHQKGYGNLCFRLVGNSKENLEKIAKKLNFVYNKKLIAPLLRNEIDFKYLYHYPILSSKKPQPPKKSSRQITN